MARSDKDIAFDILGTDQEKQVSAEDRLRIHFELEREEELKVKAILLVLLCILFLILFV